VTPVRRIHFAALCPPTFSHAAGTISLARQLQKRGHQVTFFNILDLEQRVVRQGIDFCAIGLTDHPAGSLQAFVNKMGQLKGIPALKFGMQTAIKETRTILRDAPEAMRERGVTALLIDQGEPAGSTVAEHLRLPFATLCQAIPANRDPRVPPTVTPWRYDGGWLMRMRNRLAHHAVALVFRPLLKVINQSRSEWGLKMLCDVEETYSPLIQVSQATEDFDFPNPSLPPHFHYIGLYEKESSQEVDFPFDRLNGKPLVYATAGTVQTGLKHVYFCIAEACATLDVQLVITLGSKDAEPSAALQNLPGGPIVVGFAPQNALLERATATICHGGLNTVLESLRSGVPVISIPITVDQPANGARLQRSGAGETIVLKALNSARLRDCLERVLNQPGYRERARTLGRSIAAAGGSTRAAELIEEAMPGGKS
jgi:MGT family glycosyltransferase